MKIEVEKYEGVWIWTNMFGATLLHRKCFYFYSSVIINIIIILSYYHIILVADNISTTDYTWMTLSGSVEIKYFFRLILTKVELKYNAVWRRLSNCILKIMNADYSSAAGLE